MFKKYISLFIKDADDVENPTVREKYGKVSGITGIILNILMSLAKILAGVITGAISVLSDGINNLSDAGSSIVTLIGFKLSAKKPDKEHPFGHGRIEYFAGLIVSAIIIFVAVELFIESINKIIAGGSDVDTSKFLLTCIILCVSIGIKLWMALFNKYIGKKINSVAISATALDSVSDCISTTVVLICSVLSLYVKNFPIDGIAGVAVSLFILYTGLKAVKEIVDLLLGQAPDPKLVHDIAEYVQNFDKNIVGIHDLMFHDYGPGRKIVILHAEVPANGNIMELHDVIDNIEQGLSQKYNCIATIHMDPVVINSERVNELKELCKNIVKELDECFTIHDFRMNEGDTHANLIFDLVITHENKLSEDEIKEYVIKRIKDYDAKLNAVIKVEYSFV